MWLRWTPPEHVLKHYQDKQEQAEIQKEMNAQFYKDLGLWLRKHRQQCGYSIGQVSDKTGISNATYTFYEIGAMKMMLLDFVLLCGVLKTDFRYNGSFRLEPEEMEMVEALRRKDIKRVLQWLQEEI